MTRPAEAFPRKSRLAALLEHFSQVEDPRDVRRILHPLPEVLFLVVCGSIADCDDYEEIAAWGAAHLDFLRRHLPFEHGVPGERWLTILMNRINPSLFAAAFADWVRESWPDKAGLVAIDGKTSRRSHDRSTGAGPLHLVSAFATTARLVLAQEAVPDKASELAAIPPLLERLGAEDGLKGALVSIDAIATNADIARAITAQGADYLLAVKATAVLRDTGWLEGARRFPGELRLPGTTCLVRAETRVETKGKMRSETRYFISSRPLSAADAAAAIRGHWAIENRLHWVLDVTFADDQSRLRKGHGARNMATVRHFALNLVRTATDKRSIKSRRKIAGWDTHYFDAILASRPA